MIAADLQERWVDIDYVVRLLVGRLPFTLVQVDPQVLVSYAG